MFRKSDENSINEEDNNINFNPPKNNNNNKIINRSKNFNKNKRYNKFNPNMNNNLNNLQAHGFPPFSYYPTNYPIFYGYPSFLPYGLYPPYLPYPPYLNQSNSPITNMNEKEYRNQINLINESKDLIIDNNMFLPNIKKNEVIYVSTNEKETENTDKNYYHLCNFEPIKNEDIIIALKKNNIDSKNIEEVINKMESENKTNKRFYLNDGLFYSKEKMSIYFPHLIKNKKINGSISIFLPNDDINLKEKDFQYSNYTEIEDIFLLTLKKRIEQFNLNETSEDFGFFYNSDSVPYLYTKIPEEIIGNKLKSTNINDLKANLLGNLSSSIDTSYTNSSLGYITFKSNSNYLKGLTFEQLILNIILNDIEYKELPRLILYEYFLNIKGERMMFISDDTKIYRGFNEMDFIFISFTNYKYEPELTGLNVLHYFEFKDRPIYLNNSNFEIKKDTLYLFELKNSLYNSNHIELIKETIKKGKEFRRLFISKKIINEMTPIEIIIIYDDNITNYFYYFKEDIFSLLKCNKYFKISIVYALQSYPYFSHSINKKQINELKKNNLELSKKYGEMEKNNLELSKKYGEMEKNNLELNKKYLKLSEKYGEMEKNNLELIKKYGEMEIKLRDIEKKINN